MAVDRGSLRYTILVEDKFTGPIRKFREELLKARSTLNFFRSQTADLGAIQGGLRAATTETRRYREEQRAQAAEDRKAKAEQIQALRRLAANQKVLDAQQKFRRAKVIDEQRESKRLAKEQEKAARAAAKAAQDQARAAARAAQEQERAAARSAAASERASRQEQINALRRLAANQRTLTEVERTRAAMLKNERAETAAKEKNLQKANRAAAAAAAAEKRAADAASKKNRELLSQFTSLNDGANRVAFTFRRLFGILAAFTLARQAVGAFTGMIGAAIQFNRSVEDTQIGLAALFTTLGQVEDGQGRITEGAEAFARAQGAAAKQVEALRLDALRTTATFEELSRAFQAALAPGLAAGLPLEQIRELTTLISQAAAAFPGLSQDQLPEEIRALLIPGAATSRTSRIFTALQIKPEELERAKEAGKLFEFLQSRLKPFDLAAEATQKTFTGLVARLKDAVGIASGGASVVFFRELKGLLIDVGDAFVQVERDADGAIKSIQPNPQAVQTLAILFDGLKAATATLRAGLNNVDLGQLQNAVSVLADGIKGAAQIATGFVQGLIAGISNVASIARGLFAAFDSPALREAAALVTRIGVLMVAAGAAVSALIGSLKLALLPLTFLTGQALKLAKAFGISTKFAEQLAPKLKKALPVVAALTAGFVLAQIAAEKINRTLTDPQAKAEAEARLSDLGAQLNSLRRQERDLESRPFLTGGINGSLARLGQLKQEIKEVQERIKEVTTGVVDKKEAKEISDRINKAIEQGIEDSRGESTLAQLLSDLNTGLDGLIGGDIVDEESILAKLKKLEEEANKLLDGEVKPKGQEEQLNGFEQALNQMREVTQAQVAIMQGTVTSFASFASDAIVSAFDPNNDQTLSERFAAFLQGLARQVLETIISLLVATAIAKAFGVPLPSDSTPPPQVFLAKGGEVPNEPAHGVKRPKNIPASDTVAAWLTPGEFVQTTKAVALYGADVLDALNKGAIDPSLLRSLVGGQRSIARGVRKVRNAYAAGGIVTQTKDKLDQSTATATATESKVNVAAVVANDAAMERLLSGGKAAQLQFIRENASAINAVLRSSR